MNNNSVIDNGDSVIPASQRPDGTWRKARRVKEGYVPQEEVPLYESKGKQYTSKNNKPESITLPSGQIAHRPIPGLYIVEEKEKKPTKKKNKNKSEGINIKLESSNKTLSSLPNANVKVKKEENNVEVAPTLPEKKLKNLKKRLREIESLEEKLKNCTIAKPEPEQLMKIQRKNDLILQIYQLEKLLE